MSKKQAVLLIHGIGEQKPMDTLRGFVDAVWTTDTGIHHKHATGGVWSKPDTLSRSYELRRLTTPQNANEIRTDFFEFYWAHLMKGTSYGHVLAWARSLVWRRPGSVPKHLTGVYWILLILLISAVFLALYTAYSQAAGGASIPPWLSALGTIVLLPIAGFILLRVVGDAARYLHVAPSNIQMRHMIRQAGVELLRALHDPAREYSRIIVVGHSLGSVIGYDILTHAWVDFHQKAAETASETKSLEALEALAQSEKADSNAVQAAQRRYFDELVTNGNLWRVTDFVTLGSPLAHSAILLAKDADDLRQKQEAREFPHCLPTLEATTHDKKTVQRFAYSKPTKGNANYRVPHHAAVFGPTRWTNLYFPCTGIVHGDLVGGPLKEVMGAGIKDVRVSTQQQLGFLTHTLYWKPATSTASDPHIAALRKALDLTDRGQITP